MFRSPIPHPLALYININININKTVAKLGKLYRISRIAELEKLAQSELPLTRRGTATHAERKAKRKMKIAGSKQTICIFFSANQWGRVESLQTQVRLLSVQSSQ